jgi:hypothetical protein
MLERFSVVSWAHGLGLSTLSLAFQPDQQSASARKPRRVLMYTDSLVRLRLGRPLFEQQARRNDPVQEMAKRSIVDGLDGD